MVSILYLFDRHVRAAQLEARLAKRAWRTSGCNCQPHFLFNALNTVSSVVYEDPRKADAMIAASANCCARRSPTPKPSWCRSIARSRRWSCTWTSCATVRGQADGRRPIEPESRKPSFRTCCCSRSSRTPSGMARTPTSQCGQRDAQRPNGRGTNARPHSRPRPGAAPKARPARHRHLQHRRAAPQLYGAEHTLAFENATTAASSSPSRDPCPGHDPRPHRRRRGPRAAQGAPIPRA